MTSRTAAGAIAFGVLAALGCNARVDEEYQVFSLVEIEEALDQGGHVAVSDDTPDGIPASDLLTRNPNGVTLNVQRAFAEGKPAAFVTTDIWVDYYDSVWTQPLYAQYVDATTPVDLAPRVIDVGPESTFYSPFWQVSAAVVGPVPADRYHSAKELLDNASEIIPAGMRTCPLGKTDVLGTLALPAPWSTWNITLQTVATPPAVLDDEGDVAHFNLLDFGPNLFELSVEAHGAIVEPSPMFVFANPNGTLNTQAPRVLGAGEVVVDPSGKPRPRYGGLWRLIKVVLPDSAGAFVGSEHAAARDAASAAGIDPLEYEGRFAQFATCFNDAANFPGGCAWLDSQEQLESLLGDARLESTDIQQTGPIVLYDKQPVNW